MIKIAEPVLDGNELRYVVDCIRRRQLSGAQYVELFESAFAEWIGAKYAIATTSGTTALHLALVALGVHAGQEVIVPDLTFVATANAVLMCGATPIFCDVDLPTMVMDVQHVAELITERTVGIIPVHLYGNPVAMRQLLRIAGEHFLFVLEDAAEAPGTTYHGISVGTLGQAACFSFYGNKLLTMGEGGAITTNDAALADKLRRLRGQGVDPQRRYWHTELGYNYRLSELQGAVGLAQVEAADSLLARRKVVAKWYREEQGPWRWQQPTAEAQPAWWMNVAILDENMPSRDSVIEKLARSNIESRPVFYPLHVLPAFQDFQHTGDFANSKTLSRRGIVLPSHNLLSPSDVHYICEEIRACGKF